MVLVTIAVVFLVDMIGLYLPGTAKVLIVVIAIILYFVLITMIDRLKRRA